MHHHSSLIGPVPCRMKNNGNICCFNATIQATSLLQIVTDLIIEYYGYCEGNYDLQALLNIWKFLKSHQVKEVPEELVDCRIGRLYI